MTRHIQRTRAGRRFGDAARADDGVSIIEVLVATVIFLIVSVGVLQATVTAVRLAGDQRHRVTALSLAASEIDYVRSLADPFEVLDRDLEETIDGITYSLERETEWVSGTGVDIPCSGGGTDNLQLKRVNVSVVWSGQLSATSPVSSDTVLAPVGRISNPTLGTIMIAATRADGTGAAGVDVAVAPTSGSDGESLDNPPPDTNAEGCSYALQVVPGEYTITLSRSGYVDAEQHTAPTATVEVTAGSTTSAPFTFDAASTFTLSYAPMADRPSTVRFADNNETTYVNTYGASYVTSSSATVQLFPWSAGYRPIAGHYVAPDPSAPGGSGGCPAVDPVEWSAATVQGVALAAGQENPAIATEPGASAPMTVPMGIVQVKNVERRDWVIAVSVNGTAVPGVPGCAVGMTYRFANVSSSSTREDRYLALPYGTWQLYSANSSSGTRESFAASAIVLTSNLVKTGPMISGNTVVVDPRTAP